MKIKFVFLFPALVVYTGKLPQGTAGRAHGPIVLIRKEYRKDNGLHAHELHHVLQWYCTLMLHPLLYCFYKPYKLWAEVSAYRKQLEHSPGNGNKYAGFIADRYGLDVTEQAALKLLQNK